MNPAGLMLSDDLIFFSRVAGAARAAGLAVRQEKTAEALLARAREHPPRGIILDLHNPGLDLPVLLSALRDCGPVPPFVVAYGSHVEAEVLRQARQAGCDRVMPRSQFVQELDSSLPAWLSGDRH